MNLNDYPIHAMSFRLETADAAYAFLNLPSEVGELFGHAAKALRDGAEDETLRQLILKELGDVLWTITAIAEDMESSLDEIASINIDKLTARKANGTIQGSGDTR
jgi:NTP pyrophosphatase (non-canonical NTP hydrolase)